MKKVLFLFALTGFLFSCSSPSTPEAVAARFVESLAHGDFGEAKKYATETVASMLEMASNLGGDELELNPSYKFKLIDKKVEGDKATITYEGPDGKEDTIDLKKVDGEWKVYLEK